MPKNRRLAALPVLGLSLIISMFGLAIPVVRGAAPGLHFSPDALKSRVSSMVGERYRTTSANRLKKTRKTIQTVFKEAGWEVEVRPFSIAGVDGTNIVARRLGRANPERTWIMGAHYDTARGTPGADDNASGIAGILEAARLLSRHSFRDTVELVAWDLEESLHGGSEHMAGAARRAGTKIQCAVSLEMIGFRRIEPGSQRFPDRLLELFPDIARWSSVRQHRGDFIAAIGDPGARGVLSAIDAAGKRSGLPVVTIEATGRAQEVRHLLRSDHASFWAEGYPGVMITDTANFRNPNYHKASDTIETLDFEFAAAVMNAVTEVLLQQAGGGSE
ncbi:MAG: M20/M25/M40 family metallo-hydrolase [Candidatus Riflebacteria bacterium]|nr:M20/M25/M40 family metallo-hydrolase [Candidatus Riflebacteria bacterium]